MTKPFLKPLFREIFKHKTNENNALCYHLGLIINQHLPILILFAFLWSVLEQNSSHFIKHFLKDFFIMLINAISKVLNLQDSFKAELLDELQERLVDQIYQ